MTAQNLNGSSTIRVPIAGLDYIFDPVSPVTYRGGGVGPGVALGGSPTAGVAILIPWKGSGVRSFFLNAVAYKPDGSAYAIWQFPSSTSFLSVQRIGGVMSAGGTPLPVQLDSNAHVGGAASANWKLFLAQNTAGDEFQIRWTTADVTQLDIVWEVTLQETAVLF